MPNIHSLATLHTFNIQTEQAVMVDFNYYTPQFIITMHKQNEPELKFKSFGWVAD